MAHGLDPEQPAASPVGGSVLRGVVEAAAFLCELAMLVLLAVAGWGLGTGGLMSIALAVFYPALAILIWSVWMAPTSSRRLADPSRLIAQVVLFVGTAVLAVTARHPMWGIAFAAIATLTFTASRYAGGITGGGPRR
jgi:hypothetical protein